MPLAIGTILEDRYRIDALLGSGGMGAVYRAWDQRLDRHVAIKENAMATPESARQFEREAKMLARLRHSNLPGVSDHFVAPNGAQYLVMDYVDGEDLGQMLQRLGPLDEARALAWIEQTCNALIYLHGQQPPIIHRDVKPGNIKITPEGQVFLVDFGIAKVGDAQAKTTMGALGVTPGFSPPEQYGQGGTDARSDVYALGATLYALLIGRSPPDSVQRAIQAAVLPPPRSLRPDVSPAVADALEAAMETNPSNRPQTVVAFQAILRGEAEPVAPSAHEAPTLLKGEGQPESAKAETPAFERRAVPPEPLLAPEPEAMETQAEPASAVEEAGPEPAIPTPHPSTPAIGGKAPSARGEPRVAAKPEPQPEPMRASAEKRGLLPENLPWQAAAGAVAVILIIVVIAFGSGGRGQEAIPEERHPKPTEAVAVAEAIGTPTVLPTAMPTVPPTRTPTSTPMAIVPPSRTPTSTSSPTVTATPTLASASTHLWLASPIGPESEGDRYPGTYFPYGSTGGGRYHLHHGVDYMNPAGTPVLAAAAGTVIVAGDDLQTIYGAKLDYYGNLVIQELDQRFQGQPVYLLYAHLSAVHVQVGQYLQSGDVLGLVGKTGVAIGNHLHLEVRLGSNEYDSTRNPVLWLQPESAQGVIAGLVAYSQGQPVPETPITFFRASEPDKWWRQIQTYASEGVNPDDQLGENFALGYVPAGDYLVRVSLGDKSYIEPVSVSAGQVGFVVITAEQ